MKHDDQYKADAEADAEADAWIKAHGGWNGDTLSAAEMLDLRRVELPAFGPAPEFGQVDFTAAAQLELAHPSAQSVTKLGRREGTTLRVNAEASLVPGFLQSGPKSKAEICAACELTDYTFRQAVKTYRLVQTRGSFQGQVLYALP